MWESGGADLISSLACGQNADVNEDLVINSVDTINILFLVAGFIDGLPAHEQSSQPAGCELGVLTLLNNRVHWRCPAIRPRVELPPVRQTCI